MKKFSITGGIGSGKTTVAKLFEQLDVPVYYSDDEAKRLMDENEFIRTELCNLFGNIYIENKLDRKTLAKIIFNDKESLKKVNVIVHKVVREDFEEWCKKQNTKYVLQESAIVFESGFYRDFDKIIVVYAPDHERFRRAVNRDKSKANEEEIRNKMKNQWTDKERLEKADYVINNYDSDEPLILQVLKLHDILNET